MSACRLLSLVSGLLSAAALVAWCGPSIAAADAPDAVLQQFVGTYTYVGGDAEIKALEPRLDLRPEAFKAILDEVSEIDPRAKKVKPEDLMDRRFLDEMDKSGFFNKLWAKG